MRKCFSAKEISNRIEIINISSLELYILKNAHPSNGKMVHDLMVFSILLKEIKIDYVTDILHCYPFICTDRICFLLLVPCELLFFHMHVKKPS